MFAVIPNLSRENAFEVTKDVCQQLKKLNAEFAMDIEKKSLFEDFCNFFFDTITALLSPQLPKSIHRPSLWQA